jgi:PAS domain S-box-containing protein
VLLGIDMSEERLRSLVQHFSDIITVVDADGTILYESPTVERGLGYKPKEQVGKHTFDFVHPGDLEQVRKIFTEALAKPGPTQRQRFGVPTQMAPGAIWKHSATTCSKIMSPSANRRRGFCEKAKSAIGR